jgi:hypothetical protein
MAMVSAIERNKTAGWATGLAAVLGLLCSTTVLVPTPAQTPSAGNVPATATPPQATDAPKSNKSNAVKHPHSGKARAGKATVAPAPLVETQLPAPPPPDWPVNDAAVPASVAWNGRDLSIAASNASLDQILHDVSTATGLKIEGLESAQDQQSGQRIYGSYGPAPERDVLTQLLDGSGYNVLMIGNQGEGTPRELVLTAKAGGNAKGQPGGVQPKHDAEEDQPEDPEPAEPQPDPVVRRPPGIPPQPGQGRTPQQIMQDMQQRQQLQQQQQQPQGAQPQQQQPQGAQPQPPSN